MGSMYTKRHFVQIAGLIRQIPTKARRKTEAEKYARAFRDANPLFSKEKFMKACGL